MIAIFGEKENIIIDENFIGLYADQQESVHKLDQMKNETKSVVSIGDKFEERLSSVDCRSLTFFFSGWIILGIDLAFSSIHRFGNNW